MSSSAAARKPIGFRKLCQGCHERKARFQYRGIVRADRDHTLCFECYRSERDRQRSRSLRSRQGCDAKRLRDRDLPCHGSLIQLNERGVC